MKYPSAIALLVFALAGGAIVVAQNGTSGKHAPIF